MGRDFGLWVGAWILSSSSAAASEPGCDLRGLVFCRYEQKNGVWLCGLWSPVRRIPIWRGHSASISKPRCDGGDRELFFDRVSVLNALPISIDQLGVGGLRVREGR